jgi:hypothetical protein
LPINGLTGFEYIKQSLDLTPFFYLKPVNRVFMIKRKFGNLPKPRAATSKNKTKNIRKMYLLCEYVEESYQWPPKLGFFRNGNL